MKDMRNQVVTVIAAIVGIVATAFAMSDNFISQATFSQFKEYVVYRLDSIDHKLDLIIQQDKQK